MFVDETIHKIASVREIERQGQEADQYVENRLGLLMNVLPCPSLSMYVEGPAFSVGIAFWVRRNIVFTSFDLFYRSDAGISDRGYM
jgi:hypothetical protein